MTIATPCPCGHPRPYADCCGPLHRGERAADTAEALMRSRFAAFSRSEVDYLLATWHPDTRPDHDRAGLEDTCRALVWTGLTITETVAGGPEDDHGIVAFQARYMQGARPGVLEERSRFARVHGRWHYRDGDMNDRRAEKTGRNDPCPCGSGKKFKRCCG